MLFDGEKPIAPPSPIGLGAAMAGGRARGSKTVRQPNDYYPTPDDCTAALLVREQHSLKAAAGGPVWEPCGRGGAIVRVLKRFGFDVVASDIVADPVHDVIAADLMTVKKPMARAVVTNPPFALSSAMIEKLLGDLDVQWCALLLKSTYWHAAQRLPLFRRHRPARIYALSWRPDFLGLGAPTMECSWFVWDRSCAGLGTRFDVLANPTETQAPDLFAGAGL